MKMRRKCRLWWPNHISAIEPASSLLFGWFVSSSSTSLDIVVAFACDEFSFSSIQSALQGIVHDTCGSMALSLQDKCKFSLLGHCAVNLTSNGKLRAVGVDEHNYTNSGHDNTCTKSSQGVLGKMSDRGNCGCSKLDGLLDRCRLISLEKNSWIQVAYDSHGYMGRNIKWVPKLHHIHWNGQTVFHFDLHVILYDTPMFGSHHLSVGFWGSSEQVKTHLKKPKWVEELHQKKAPFDLDAVVLSINSANAAKLLFERHVVPEKCTISLSIVFRCISWGWKLLAVSTASLSTLLYIIFQCLHILLSFGTYSWIHLLVEKVFSNTMKNILIRRSQVLYWPILLKDNGLRSQACVEYAEKTGLHKHCMWSSVAVDILLGYFLGIPLFIQAESACLCVSNFADDITNYFLRTGCVWLMGVPAGFKLNTELAGVLGMISLNAIQIWSTLWFFVGSLFVYFVKGLSIVAVLFGLTTPAALIVDVILLVTLHLSTLHWLISRVYSQQIQAIAALWRLFRGRKWNPLRQRYDSYDYTVEQHIAGSLLFTPLLLLLPTTSVFYIFFTIMKSSVCFTCIAIDIAISITHATPYMKIILWLVRPKRFPSGVWFEHIYSQSNAVDSLDTNHLRDAHTPSEKSQRRTDVCGNRSTVLVSFIHSNILNIGQLVWPHYRYILSVGSGSFVASSAYGVLTGRSIPLILGTGLPSPMPWRFIPFREYWQICYDAVLSRETDRQCDAFQ